MTVNVVSEGAVDLQFTFHIRSHMQNNSIGVEVYYIVRDLAVHAPCVRETKCGTTHWFRNQWWRQPHTPLFVKQHARFFSKGARLWPHHQGVKQNTLKRYGSVNCKLLSYLTDDQFLSASCTSVSQLSGELRGKFYSIDTPS